MSEPSHDDRISKIEARLNALEASDAQLHTRLTELSAEKDSLQGQLNELAEQVSQVLHPHPDERGESNA